MRWVFLRTLFVPVSLATDACQFVGLRLGKMTSTCDMGICTNLGFSADMGHYFSMLWGKRDLQPVSCEDARQKRDAIYSSIPQSEKSSKRKRSPLYDVMSGFLADIGSRIDPMARQVLYSNQELTDETIEAMRRADRALLRMSSDEVFWRRNSMRVTNSEEVLELRKTWRLMVDISISSPLTYDMHTGLTAPWIHFMLDLGSVIGDIGLRPGEVDLLAQIAALYPTAHRAAYDGEYSFHRIPKISSVIKAAIIDEISEGDLTNFSRFAHIIVSLQPPHLRTAADAIVYNRLQSVVCADLLDVVSIKVETMSIPYFTKAGVTMIAMCGQLLPALQLINASVRLGILGLESSNDLAFESPSAVDFFDPSLPWIRGLNLTVVPEPVEFVESALGNFLASHSVVNERNGIVELKTPTEFTTRLEFDNLMTAFGRAIGLVLRYSGSLTRAFQLRWPQFTELHQSAEGGDFTSALPAMFFIRRGIQAILGPMGIDAFILS